MDSRTTHRLATRIESAPGYLMSDDRRETPRLAFPADLHPTLDLPSGPVRILDYTSNGVRFAIEGDTERPKSGAHLKGTACFTNVHTVPISGIVVWTTKTEVGLTLDPPGIPASIVDASLDSVARLV